MLHSFFISHKIQKYRKIKRIITLPLLTVKRYNVKQNETFFLQRNINYSIFLYRFVPDFRCVTYEKTSFLALFRARVLTADSVF